MNKPHTVLCVMGKSAVGKDTLVNSLCEKTGAHQLISYTTRQRREGEGDTHIFVDESDYESMKNDNKILAETKIGEYYYWSTYDQFYDSDVYVIDYMGLKTLEELNLPGIKIVSVYLHASNEVREDRALNKRGDDKVKFSLRNRAEKLQFKELLEEEGFDYAIQTERFPEAMSILKWIYIAEGGRYTINGGENL